MASWQKFLIGLAAGATAMLAPVSAQARTISNIASIDWISPAGPVSVRSNRVDISVTPAPPPTVETAIYRVDPPNGTNLSRIDGSGCRVANQGSSSNEQQSGSTGSVSLTRSTSFTAGQSVAIGIRSPADNRDPLARESFDVTVRTDNGDAETLRLTEDAGNSGFFVGYLVTVRRPPALVQGDCRLSVDPGSGVQIGVYRGYDATALANATANFLIDPFGIVFDSGDGAPVPGARVTLINADTGRPADVFGDDGLSVFPSSVVTGSTVTDAGGTVYAFPPGDYRFPFVAPGNYRLIVEPPEPYRWQSSASPSTLADFRRPDDGRAYTIFDASYGAVFALVTPAAVRVDIPVDRPSTGLTLSKSASTPIALPGEILQYRVEIVNNDVRRTTGVITVSDDVPRSIRVRPDSLRYNGSRVDGIFAPDGRRFTVTVPALQPASRGLLTYLGEVRPDARPGDALNIVSATDDRGSISNVADSLVRIRRDALGDRIVLIGRVTDQGCRVDPDGAPGVAGVRVMLQDGSFTITDAEGRYHFEGVRPGLSVVQIDPSSLPPGHVPVDCADNVRAAGSAISRFVEGRGGELKRADFRIVPVTSDEAPAEARLSTVVALSAPSRPAVVEDRLAGGAERDFFAGESAGIGWLFPDPDHNPRSPSIRIAIKHLRGQSVALMLNDAPVDALNFDGVQTSPDGSFQISSWRGVEIAPRTNRLVARILNADGSLAEELQRSVHYAGSPIGATVLRDQSLLVADGLNRPVIAVRLLDRDGRPAKHGLVGDFTVQQPHRAAIERDAEQSLQLSGLERARTTWRVEGDDGIAYIELEPTTASGTARLSFEFRDGTTVRQQDLDVWLNPGDRPWTVVGFAAGTVGFNTLDDRMEPVAESLPDDNIDGRIALYAKGRVLGEWLITLSYDSDKEADDARFGGVIDPRAYYTIYADRADRGFDAASVRNLYLRLERPQFYALFGDFETGINEPQLTRYQRSMNGVKAEYGGDNLNVTAFVADTPYRYRRDEMQGNGLSGPYALSARGILANSERVTIEVRDRLRANFVIGSRTLTRHIDYDIDYFAGTLRFREPILSRDLGLNPQFIIVDYEVDGVGERVLNAGGRASWTSDDDRLRVGATAIRDESDSNRSLMGGVDLTYRPDPATELRAEFAQSNSDATAPGGRDTGTASAWLIEAEHHGSVFDLLAYARQRDSGFGVGQLTDAGDGSRKFGFDGKLRLGADFSLIASAWQEEYFDRDARRRAARLLGEWRTSDTTLRAGLTHASDALGDGTTNRSTLVQLGGTQRLLGQRLELDAQTEFALAGKDESVDFPARHRLGARFAVNQAVALVGSYEIADGGSVDARTARVGLDIRPWSGGRATLSGSQQDITEFGSRSYAAYGLAQSLQVSERLSVDVTLDGQRTLRGISAADVLDPAQPVASGGLVDGAGSITEDFTAVTAGATYRAELWSLTGRAEYRDGELSNRFGVTLGGIRQLGEGSAFGGLLTWTRADGTILASTETLSAEVSWAHRPADSRWSFLEKLEFRSDSVTGAVAGAPGPIGGPALTVDGDARSRRVINSLTINYSPLGEDRGRWSERGEYALFWGLRFAADRFGADDVAGWSTIVGADFRFDLSQHVGVGVAGTVRGGTDARARAWGGGPQVTVAPFDNANIVIGYNVAGFRDRDFEESRYTRDGVYVTFRLKFDQTSFRGLGL